MDTLLGEHNASMYEHNDTPDEYESINCSWQYPTRQHPLVQIELPINVIEQLLSENKLFIEQLHCLNSRSKTTLKRSMLHSLISAKTQNQ